MGHHDHHPLDKVQPIHLVVHLLWVSVACARGHHDYREREGSNSCPVQPLPEKRGGVACDLLKFSWQVSVLVYSQVNKKETKQLMCWPLIGPTGH